MKKYSLLIISMLFLGTNISPMKPTGDNAGFLSLKTSSGKSAAGVAVIAGIALAGYGINKAYKYFYPNKEVPADENKALDEIMSNLSVEEQKKAEEVATSIILEKAAEEIYSALEEQSAPPVKEQSRPARNTRTSDSARTTRRSR